MQWKRGLGGHAFDPWWPAAGEPVLLGRLEQINSGCSGLIVLDTSCLSIRQALLLLLVNALSALTVGSQQATGKGLIQPKEIRLSSRISRSKIYCRYGNYFVLCCVGNVSNGWQCIKSGFFNHQQPGSERRSCNHGTRTLWTVAYKVQKKFYNGLDEKKKRFIEFKDNFMIFMSTNSVIGPTN